MRRGGGGNEEKPRAGQVAAEVASADAAAQTDVIGGLCRKQGGGRDVVADADARAADEDVTVDAAARAGGCLGAVAAGDATRQLRRTPEFWRDVFFYFLLRICTINFRCRLVWTVDWFQWNLVVESLS